MTILWPGSVEKGKSYFRPSQFHDSHLRKGLGPTTKAFEMFLTLGLRSQIGFSYTYTMTLTHWFQLRDELLFCPLLLLPPQRHRVGDQHLVVVRVGHVQVVHKDNIRILHQNLIKSKLFSRLNLKEPIASTVEGWKDGGVDIAAVDALQWEKRGQCLWSVRMKRSFDAGVFIFHTRRGSLDIFAPGASGERLEHSWVEQEAD